MLAELLRREKDLNIKPDPYLDALMKVTSQNKKILDLPLPTRRVIYQFKQSFKRKIDVYNVVIFLTGVGSERTQRECGHRLCFKGVRT